MHHIYIQLWRDTTHQWILASFRLIKKEFDVLIIEWEEGWKITVEEEDDPPPPVIGNPQVNPIEVQDVKIFAHNGDGNQQNNLKDEHGDS